MIDLNVSVPIYFVRAAEYDDVIADLSHWKFIRSFFFILIVDNIHLVHRFMIYQLSWVNLCETIVRYEILEEKLWQAKIYTHHFWRKFTSPFVDSALLR